MGAGMSRFVLLSAAVHLGVLAALGYGAVRPRLLPSTLSVTLNEPSGVTAEAERHIDTHQPSVISGASAAGKDVRHPAPSASAKSAAQETPQNPAPSLLEAAPQNSEANNDESDPVSPHSMHEITANTPSPPGRGWPVEPGEGAEIHDFTEQAAIPQAPQLDAPALASRLADQLRDALASYFTYPLIARRNGWEGQVQVGLRVEADGRLSHVRIAHSSGYRTLDSAALTTLGRINALPAAAGWLDGLHFDMVLPIDYRLIDGQS